jgi:hypothetical protein
MPSLLAEPIQVEFDRQPVLLKRTGCPDRFHWRGEWFAIVEIRSEWHRYSRHGSAAKNMTPAHAEAAEQRGSLGVGRDYYKVRTETNRVFTLYYDRSPKNADDTLGTWILLEEEPSDSAENPQGVGSDPT